MSKFHDVIKKTSEIILDKENQIVNTVVCMIARGHLLIEDEPGVGKTTLAQTIAKLTGLQQSRIQFTNDLLPADIIGHMVFNNDKHEFYFKEGPLFSELVLADELNRANPKTQSALLQAMEESSVTVDRKTYALAENFFLIATQNPKMQIGTYALPESQVDRFLMSIHLNYISKSSEVRLLSGDNPRKMVEGLTPILGKSDIIDAHQKSQKIHLDSKLAEFIADLLQVTRIRQDQFNSLSTRAGLALVQTSRARAFLNGRDFVSPDDLSLSLKPVLAHRLADQQGLPFGEQKVEELLQLVQIPQ
jgi:MoxR-like ATPase